MAENHADIMGSRPHYWLELLGTVQDYQDKGAASLLINWGLQRADEERVECYIDSSPQAISIYERFGWVVKKRSCMVRQPQPRDRVSTTAAAVQAG
ncbi:hypothetical protein VTN96DRAFT_5926 [Rasamsonia emersonii]